MVVVAQVPEIKAPKPHQLWIGVRFDEACGTNDGAIFGSTRYFSCPDKCDAY